MTRKGRFSAARITQEHDPGMLVNRFGGKSCPPERLGAAAWVDRPVDTHNGIGWQSETGIMRGCKAFRRISVVEEATDLRGCALSHYHESLGCQDRVDTRQREAL